MAIVRLRELLNRMGNPDWTPEVKADGERLLATLTATLAARLGTYIEPGPERSERAAVSERGMIVTDHPVYDVTRIDGVEAVTGTDGVRVPPPGWTIGDHRVYRSDLGGSLSGTFPPPAVYASAPIVDTSGLAGMLSGGGLYGPAAVATPDVPMVSISYRPGWGGHEALRGAIISKASAVMINRHDDTITARALEGQSPPPMTEDWTADEIAALGAFRSIAGPTWTRW